MAILRQIDFAEFAGLVSSSANVSDEKSPAILEPVPGKDYMDSAVDSSTNRF